MESVVDAEEKELCIMDMKDMNKEELIDICQVYKQKYLDSQKKIDTIDEQNYNLQAEVARFSAIESQYIQELENAQINDETECYKLEEKLQALNEELSKVKQNNKDHVYQLQLECQEKDDKIWSLENDKGQTVLAVPEGSVAVSHSEYDNLQSEIGSSYEKSKMLQLEVAELHEQLMAIKVRNNSLKAQMMEVENSIRETRDNNACKELEVQDVKQRLESLDRELGELRIEYNTLKSKKGEVEENSLFAEVNDKRVELQESMSTMKVQYREMKAKEKILSRQITRVKNENVVLTRSKKNVSDVSRADTYRRRVEILDELIRKYELAHSNVKDSLNSNLDNILNTTEREIEVLRQNIEMQYVLKMMPSREIVSVNSELQNCQTKYGILNKQLVKLKTEIQSLALSANDSIKSTV